MDLWVPNCSEGNMKNTQRRGLLDHNLDLNYPLPSQTATLDLSLGLSYTSSEAVNVHAQVHICSHHQTKNAIEILDDEVSVISQRAFAEVKEHSEINHSHGVLTEARRICSGHTALTTLCNNCKRKVSDDGQTSLKTGTNNKKAKNVSFVEELPQPVPGESIFSCPICLSPLIEPTSTKCGHIFCKECLLRSIKSLRSKCPTCRQKVGKRGIFRVYLPTTN